MEPMTDLAEVEAVDTTMDDLAAADDRPRVAIAEPVNLTQLSAEMGGVALCASDTEVVAAEGSGVTQKQLESAVKAHVAEPLPDPYAAVVASIEKVSDLQAKTALTELLDLIR